MAVYSAKDEDARPESGEQTRGSLQGAPEASPVLRGVLARRDFLFGMTSLAAPFARPSASENTGAATLRSAGASKNLLIGTCVSYRELQQPQFTDLLAKQSSIVVCENEMKWGRIHPEPDRFDFTRGDALMNFAESHGQKLRGHNLCWHEQLPGWFDSVATKENAAALLRRHIETVAGHYAGHVHSWDVVNEAISVKDNLPAGMRDTPWYRLIGPAYLDIAFQAARLADPHAILTYNDFDLEHDTPEYEAKRQAVLKLLQGLKTRNMPVQALGLQSHLSAGTQPYNWDPLHRFIKQVDELGLEIFVTELDVDDSRLPADIAQRDRGVAQLYRDYLDNVLQHRSVKAVLTWGLTDRDTWLTRTKPRKDGLPQRPLPFDPDLEPAPAFFSMITAIGKAPGPAPAARQQS